MKKLIIAGSVLMFVGIFGLAPVARADTFGDLQSLINKLRDQISSFRQIAATGGGLENSGSGGFVPPIGYCPAGTVGAGRVNETLRCNGSKWVAASNLLNDGTNVGIGQSAIYGSKLTVHSTGSDSAITADSRSSYGVYGGSTSGVGLHGATVSGKAVAASTETGYGFYQAGSNAKNYFMGKLGFGTANNPQESVDLGGGNIKMGYEVLYSYYNRGDANPVYQACSTDKYLISGGCTLEAGDQTNVLWSSSPDPNNPTSSWRCHWSNQSSAAVRVYAICANIR